MHYGHFSHTQRRDPGTFFYSFSQILKYRIAIAQNILGATQISKKASDFNLFLSKGCVMKVSDG